MYLTASYSGAIHKGALQVRVDFDAVCLQGDTIEDLLIRSVTEEQLIYRGLKYKDVIRVYR